MKFSQKNPAPFKNLVVFLDQKGQPVVPDGWPVHFLERWSGFLSLKDVKLDKPSIHQLYDPELERVFLVCTPKGTDPRSIGGKLGKKLINASFQTLNFLVPESPNYLLSNHFEPFLEGFFLGRYQYKGFKTEKTPGPTLTKVQFLASDTSDFGVIAQQAWIQADGTNLARDLGNHPGNHLTPQELTKACGKVAKEQGLVFEVLDEEKMAEEKMGCLLGVSQGSEEPAFLNILQYEVDITAPTLLIVGKGLTFDAGGISLKPAGGMHEMKHDMCGGAAVLGAMQIIGQTKPKINVVALIPTSENMPDGKAVKPGDVLTACNGTTVEVQNTDAEGRLILADSIAYGIKRFKPVAVVDVATLTGACMIALGHYNSGYQCNQTTLAHQIERSAEITGDPVWRMPHDEIYEKDIEGTVSDLKNVGAREGGMITAGLFLKHFAGKTPWAHIDIAGTAWSAERIPFYPDKGATGTAARLLADLANHWK